MKNRKKTNNLQIAFAVAPSMHLNAHILLILSYKKAITHIKYAAICKINKTMANATYQQQQQQ